MWANLLGGREYDLSWSCFSWKHWNTSVRATLAGWWSYRFTGVFHFSHCCHQGKTEMRKKCSLNAELRRQRKQANRTCALGEISQNVEQVVSKVWVGMGGLSRMGHAFEENWILPQKKHSCRSQNREDSVKFCLSLRQAYFFHFLWKLYSSFLDWENYWLASFFFFPKTNFWC